jgi:hypothetical protein
MRTKYRIPALGIDIHAPDMGHARPKWQIKFEDSYIFKSIEQVQKIEDGKIIIIGKKKYARPLGPFQIDKIEHLVDSRGDWQILYLSPMGWVLEWQCD